MISDKDEIVLPIRNNFRVLNLENRGWLNG